MPGPGPSQAEHLSKANLFVMFLGFNSCGNFINNNWLALVIFTASPSVPVFTAFCYFLSLTSIFR